MSAVTLGVASFLVVAGRLRFFLADLALFKEPAIGCILLKKSYKKTRLTAGFLHMSQS